MIILTSEGKKKDRIVNGVQFKKGLAKLDDSMLPKAQSICKFYNVKMAIINSESELEAFLNKNDDVGGLVKPKQERANIDNEPEDFELMAPTAKPEVATKVDVAPSGKTDVAPSGKTEVAQPAKPVTK